MKFPHISSRMLHIIFVFGFLTASLTASSQDCYNTLKIYLIDPYGIFFPNETITLTPSDGTKPLVGKSSRDGIATFSVPCNTIYSATISNNTRAQEIRIPDKNGGVLTSVITYDSAMELREKMLAMTDAEKAAVDATSKSLPDTTYFKGNVMSVPKKNEVHFALVTITLNDLYDKPLANEKLWLTSKKSKKTFVGNTGTNGKIYFYIPKGDSYSINFTYTKDYATVKTEYGNGTLEMSATYSYIGTVEFERRKKAEAERIAAEEKRLKEEAEKFKAYCKSLGISEKEGKKREAEKYLKNVNSFSDSVITAVFRRNKWSEKLIICDLTGSMQPYSSQLSMWYNLNYAKEKNLQFVFFNDGNNNLDEKKIIGKTGGIYYTSSKGIDSLFNFMNMVAIRGNGGDCPENNMEALIKGVKLAKPYKELIMIVDNNSPVKDIALLKDFNAPVHIILCGVNQCVLVDYLEIAWKTKGSIHTIEQDLTKIATMLEGQTIEIKGITYKIMGGEFVRITKI